MDNAKLEHENMSKQFKKVKLLSISKYEKCDNDPGDYRPILFLSILFKVRNDLYTPVYIQKLF